MEANSGSSSSSSLHIAMYPWLAIGHITPFLHMSNKLARIGHKISFFIPTNTQFKVQHMNHFPNLITFVPIEIPHVDGLPVGAETTSDVSLSSSSLITAAMDRTEPAIDLLLRSLQPDIIIFDFLGYWIPNLARSLGIKTVLFCTASPVFNSYLSGREIKQSLLEPPPGFPDPSIKLHRHELRVFEKIVYKKSDTIGVGERIRICSTECDVYASKGCREIEGPYIDFMAKYVTKPILLTGPVIPEKMSSSLDSVLDGFLNRFQPNTVTYCCLGSENRLSQDQFQELVLGLELSGLPFLAALKAPLEAETVEEAFPEGFAERVEGRGMVLGWVQQQLVLSHSSVGCFITHCGYGSLMEGLTAASESCQLVMIPNFADQFSTARLFGDVLKAGIEVERGEEDGLFTRETVCRAVKTVMGDDQKGIEIRANCAKLRELLLSEGFESSYIHEFSLKLQALAAK